MKSKLTILSLGLMIALSACNRDNVPKEVEGWAPVYQTSGQVTDIKSTYPQPVLNAGKIYAKEHMLYQVEALTGIHVFNISNPAQPINQSFIKIPGAQEISIKDNLLYSNNYNDLVIIDISDLGNVKLLKRMENAFKLENLDQPPMSGYFECIDPQKGKIVGWEKKLLHYPKCKF